jgi:hypothetical protein
MMDGERVRKDEFEVGRLARRERGGGWGIRVIRHRHTARQASGWLEQPAECMHLVRHTPSRRVDNDTSQASGKNTGAGQGDDPAHVDPGNHAPVNRPPGSVAETDTDGGAGDTLCGGDGELCWFDNVSGCIAVRRLVE